MRMKFGLFHDWKGRDRTAPLEAVAPITLASFDLREEYASAFRTESYNEFWARVLEQTFAYGSGPRKSTERSAAAARLPSCHIFVENLLEPDQPTVARVLAHARGREDDHPHRQHFPLISDYFTETANASLLCGLLLKDIEKIRLCYRPLKKTLHSLVFSGDASPGGHFRAIADHLADLSKVQTPFGSLQGVSSHQFQEVQSGTASLLKRLESGRTKARTRLRLLTRLKRGLAVLFVALTVSTSVVGVYVAFHLVVALMVALPALLPVPFRMASTRWMARVVAQLDAAAKGTYILSRDLDTVSRLLARLHDETEHMLAMLRFCFERRGDQLRPTQEVVRQLKKNDASFNQQLDELEEHLYLCFMTINKTRSLVMKEVLMPAARVNKL